jgi:hypothetical protein
LPFSQVPRPMFPLDRDMDIVPWLRDHQGGVYLPQPARAARGA